MGTVTSSAKHLAKKRFSALPKPPCLSSGACSTPSFESQHMARAPGRPRNKFRRRTDDAGSSSPTPTRSSSSSEGVRSPSPAGTPLEQTEKAARLKFLAKGRALGSSSDDESDASSSNPTKLRSVVRKASNGWRLDCKIPTDEVCHWLDKKVR